MEEMKKMKLKAVLVLASSSLCSILIAPLSAQSLNLLRVNIPFEFGVQGKTMPAGEYEVRTNYPNMIQIIHADGSHESLGTRAVIADVSNNDGQPSLSFRKLGSQYFLALVSTGGGRPVLGITPERVERELARTASSHPVQTVTLVASRGAR